MHCLVGDYPKTVSCYKRGPQLFHLLTTSFRLDVTRQQVLQEREDIKTNITMMVEMLANHKQHVEDRLKELQQFYTEQYSALQM